MTSTPHAIEQDFYLSHMTEHDLLEVVELEEKSGLSRWGWGAYYGELQSNNRNFMLVARPARTNNGILGYIVARHVAGELHINNVAVRDTARRRGIGITLMRSVVDEARAEGAKIAFLEVRSGNAGAQALYEKCGFRAIARRRNYYTAPLEDAIVMSMPF
jgi:[ribosomal protein S18]-alanine N-acetyltransferase